MTEEEWLATPDPRPLIGYLQSRLSDRKARLFAVACCRMVSHLTSDDGSGHAVEVAERFADGLASGDERAAAWAVIGETVSLSNRTEDASWWADSAVESAVTGFYSKWMWYKAAATVSREVATAVPASIPAQRTALGCIVGNPFRRVAVEPAWLTPTVVALAEGVYIDRAFERLPVLADALEEAGCHNADILEHCRSGAPHVRGCWVVDLLTGRR